MGIAYSCDRESDLALALWHGPVSPVEWRDQVRSLVSEVGDRSPRRFLTDLRAAGDVSTITDEHITEVAELFARGVRGAKAKVALVASNLFESAELFEREPALSGVVTTIVFYDFGTACAWLGVDKDRVHRRTTELRREIIARGAGFSSEPSRPTSDSGSRGVSGTDNPDAP